MDESGQQRTDPRDERRVVITGIGAWTAHGPGFAALLDGYARGDSALRPVDDVIPKAAGAVAGVIRDYRPFRAAFPEVRPPLPIALTQLVLVAAREALADAALLAADDRESFGVVLGRCTGPASVVVKTMTPVLQHGAKKTSPLLFSQSVANAPVGAVTTQFGLRGPNLMVQCGAAFELAARILRRGEAPVVLCGGFDEVEALSFVASVGNGFIRPFCAAEAVRPYAPGSGSTHGEGAACLVLESLAHARARGARVYAELGATAYGLDHPGLAREALRGWGATTGAGLAALCREALAEAGVDAAQLDLHAGGGNGEPSVDATERDALAALGRGDLESHSLKGGTGDTRGAGPALALAWAAAALAGRAGDVRGARALVTHGEIHGGLFAAVLQREGA